MSVGQRKKIDASASARKRSIPWQKCESDAMINNDGQQHAPRGKVEMRVFGMVLGIWNAAG
jgi:hypothetical protein